ncbi:MAG: YdiU family protein [Bacteriovoracaceae bacterium]|nr:YdiU family protein [Bacteriovoracaceae bacterium]
MNLMLNSSYAKLPDHFYCHVQQSQFSDPKIFLYNEELFDQLDIAPTDFKNETKSSILSGNFFIPNTTPIAMAYAGHQFGHFVPSLGDGRAMLLGELQSRKNVLYDLHLKGSGRTCFSRGGDGKCALGPALREYLVSEFMHAVGIPTTRSLSVVTTGDLIHRDSNVPGAVLARIARGHIRIGTFQYFAARQDVTALKILSNYCIERFYPELKVSENPFFSLWNIIAQKQVDLILQWMSVGFIHGVLNTDNISISGETIDYGPCAFMDNYQSNKVFSFIDKNGRYAFNNQPNIILWNLAQLAQTLFPLFHLTEDHFNQVISHELQKLHESIWDNFYKNISQKMGLSLYSQSTKNLAISWLTYLETEQLDFTLSFIDLERILENKNPHLILKENESFKNIFRLWNEELENEQREKQSVIKQMRLLNPSFIPRNHTIEKIIKIAGLDSNPTSENDVLHEFLKYLRMPYLRTDKLHPLQQPPLPHEVVSNTFCGT